MMLFHFFILIVLDLFEDIVVVLFNLMCLMFRDGVGERFFMIVNKGFKFSIDHIIIDHPAYIDIFLHGDINNHVNLIKG